MVWRWNEVAWWVLRRAGTGPLLLRMHPRSALRQKGWFQSLRVRQSVDGGGNPIPWWTYPVIDFLDERLRQPLRALELGCGNSTRWLCERVHEVISLENDADWARRVEAKLPANGRIICTAGIEDFLESQSVHLGKFDVIVNDANANRIRCATAAIPLLKDSGVMIWDNTDGPDWPTIEENMRRSGLREISFSGMTPQEISSSRTTVFYRSGSNCLGI
jgi:hypothetical protein